MKLTHAQRATLNSAESLLMRDLEKVPSGVGALQVLFDESKKIPKSMKGEKKDQIISLKEKYDHRNYSKVPKEAYKAMVAGCVLAKISESKEVPGTKIPFKDWNVFFTSYITVNKELRLKLIPEVKEKKGFTASVAEYSCRAVSEVEFDQTLAQQLNEAYEAWIKV